LPEVVADRSGDRFNRSIASFAARSASSRFTTDDDAGVQVRAAFSIKDPATQSHSANAGIFANLYAEEIWFHAPLYGGARWPRQVAALS
jgi:hypothetical protein